MPEKPGTPRPVSPQGDGYVSHGTAMITEVPVTTEPDGRSRRESAIDRSVSSGDGAGYADYRGAYSKLDGLLVSLGAGRGIPRNTVTDSRFRPADLVHVPGWLLYKFRLWRTGWRKT